MPYPFPDTLDFTMNDILVFAGWSCAMSIFFVCSEDVLEWIGIPNDYIAKDAQYDQQILKRDYISQLVIALTTPFLLANGLQALVSVLGLGPIGGYMMWTYVLYVYYARNMLYNVHHYLHSYIIYNVFIFSIAFISWIPGDVVYNLHWVLWNTVMLCSVRIITGFITSTSAFVMIRPIQHVLWDPLLSFNFFKTYIDMSGWMFHKMYALFGNDSRRDD